jgi:IS30 family transposase
MGKRYDQLDLDGRIEISGLHAAAISRREIGHLMGRDAPTISRELRRNSLPRGEYKPASAGRMRSRGAGGFRRSSA